MRSYIFAYSDSIEMKDFSSIESFGDKYDEFFEVVLTEDSEIGTLFKLLGFDQVVESNLPFSEDFETLFDCSSHKLPVWSTEEFDEFYDQWLQQSGRKTDMDEYGQLVFIQGQAEAWNKNDCRFVLYAKS